MPWCPRIENRAQTIAAAVKCPTGQRTHGVASGRRACDDRRRQAQRTGERMLRALLTALVVTAIAATSPHAIARGSHSSALHASGSHSIGSHYSATHAHQGRAYAGVKRDAHGKITRDPHAKEAFQKSHPCPATG